jgi:hypothetical protein
VTETHIEEYLVLRAEEFNVYQVYTAPCLVTDEGTAVLGIRIVEKAFL